jgi:hypothetical protein
MIIRTNVWQALSYIARLSQGWMAFAPNKRAVVERRRRIMPFGAVRLGSLRLTSGQARRS